MPENSPVRDTLTEITAVAFEHNTLSDREHMMARVAALAASNAPGLSYLLNLEVGGEVGLTADDVEGVLVAVAPVIGTPRVVEAAANITKALGFAIAIAEAELERELEAEEG
jgi:hypothetical protein